MKKTHEQFVEQLKNKNKTVIPYDKYVGIKTKIRFKCLICGHITNPKLPDNVLNLNYAYNCEKCKEANMKTQKKISHNDFVKRIKKRNSKIKITSKYSNLEDLVSYECLICGEKGSNTGFNMLYNSKIICKNCTVEKRAGKRALTQFEIDERIKKHNKNIKYSLNYKNQTSRAECECLNCGYKWTPLAYSLARGSGCIKCDRIIPIQSMPKKHSVFEQEIENIYNGAIVLKSEYIGAYKPVTVLCNICNQESTIKKARNLIAKNNGGGCKICNLSRGALLVYWFLKKNNYTFEIEYSFEDLKGDSKNLRFDFAIFSEGQLSLIVEYDGEFHFHDRKMKEQNLEKQQRYDLLKSEYCKEKNIPIIRIPYWKSKEIDNILQNEIKKYINTEII